MKPRYRRDMAEPHIREYGTLPPRATLSQICNVAPDSGRTQGAPMWTIKLGLRVCTSLHSDQ